MKTPLQNVIMDEDQHEEDDEIHCLEDKGSASFLTLVAYEESLSKDQNSQEWDGGAVLQTDDQDRYNLRSKMNTAQQTPVQRVTIHAV